MMYRSLVVFICLLWITGSSCECQGNLTTGLQCYQKYNNRSSLCKEGNSTSNATLPTFLNITNTYLGDDGLLNITIDDNEWTVNSSYTYLICVMKKIRLFPSLPPFPVSSCSFNENSTFLSVTKKWQTLGEVSVYVFTSDDTGTKQGCDYQHVRIKNCSNSLNVSVKLSQTEDELQSVHDVPDVINPPIFKIGNITIEVHVKRNTSSLSSYSPSLGDDDGCQLIYNNSIESASGSTVPTGGDSSGSEGTKDKDSHQFRYSFYFPDHSFDHMETNDSKAEFVHHFDKAVNDSIFVEVIHLTNSAVRYGNQTVEVIVYEPLSNVQVSVNGKYTGNKIPFVVTAKGSLPIDIKWTINNSTDYCEKSNLTLSDGEESETFYCTFNSSGSYHINTTFTNCVSNANTNFSFTISQPPPINVVATSTSAVAILIVIIIAVVIAIVLVGTYISYRRFRNKSTETADFSFVKLNRPSRWRRLSSHADKIKDKFGKRNKRFGLVNTSDSGESLDSFYGSLNPFAAHETL